MPDEMPPGRFVQSAPQSHVLHAGLGSYVIHGQPLTLRLNPTLQFHDDGPFFPLVITFLAATAGLTPVFDAVHYPDFLASLLGVYPGVEREETHIDLEEVVKKVRGGAIDQGAAVEQLCCMLAVASYEASRLGSGSHLWRDPEVQFFRFVRHAAAHGNKWHFNTGEPKLPAIWRRWTVDRSWAGRKCFGGDLHSGDLLRLLMNIEQKLPKRGSPVVMEVQGK